MKSLLHTLSTLCVLATGPAYSAIVNGSFESPTIPAGSFNSNITTVPGWQTTDPQGRIEIWNNFQGEPAYDGLQFNEINAYQNTAVYQDTIIGSEGLVSYEFAHQGRHGVDSIQLYITYAGLDAIFGTGDDQAVVDGTLAQNQYSTGNTGWVLYQKPDAFTSVAGGLYRFAFQAVSTANGNSGEGNFLDAVSFTVRPIPEPSGAALFLGAAGIFGMRRRR